MDKKASPTNAPGVRRRDTARASPGAEGPVYPPREDTFLLERAAGSRRGERVLEIGVGEGRAALRSARDGAFVVATDLNLEALRSVRRRAKASGVTIDAVRTDLARGLKRFDLVLANPPYLPTSAASRDPDPWVNLALDGGPDGTKVMARIVRSLPAHLAPGARALLVVSSLQSKAALSAIARRWRALGGRRRARESVALGGERLGLWELTRSVRWIRS
ncbi:MAG TPA: HemK2/MTQ2 family protein methyltransferase, partial [Thermoplasmata archaeon]|nr:HemK2/MTQ2 family protein methyltransferase [Thermoplasmata archaeon]